MEQIPTSFGEDSELPFIVMDLRINFPSPSTIAMLKHCKHLRHLILRYIDRDWNDNPSIMEIPRNLESLSSFYFVICPEITSDWDPRRNFFARKSVQIEYGSFGTILSRINNLKKLVINAEFAASRKDLPAIELPKLTHLEVVRCSKNAFEEYDWLLRRTDNLQHISFFDALSFPKLPDRVTKSVTELWVHGRIKTDVLGPAISSFKRLEQIALSTYDLAIQDATNDPIGEIEGFLVDLPESAKSIRLIDLHPSCFAVFSVYNALKWTWHSCSLIRLEIDLSSFIPMETETAMKKLPIICKEQGIEYNLFIRGNLIVTEHGVREKELLESLECGYVDDFSD